MGRREEAHHVTMLQCYMLHVTIPPTHQHPSIALNHHANNYYSAYCNQKDTPAASPRASSRPPACSPSLTKNLLLPPSSPLKKTGKSALDSHKSAYFCGGRRLRPARAKQGRGSRYRVVFRCTCCSCRFLPNSIKHH